MAPSPNPNFLNRGKYARPHRPSYSAWFTIAMLTALIIAPTASAITFNGRVYSDLYAWTDTGQTHIRPYETIQSTLYAWQAPGGRLLQVHGYVRWMSDFKDKLPSDPQTYVYDLYARLTGVPENSDFSIGRQFIYTGAGSSLLDGVRAQYTALKRIHVDLYGGSTVSGVTPEKIRKYSDFGTIGGGISYQLKKSMKAGVDLLRHNEFGSLAYERYAAWAQQSTNLWQWYGRFGYNGIKSKPAEFLARVSATPSKWYFSGEYRWREPLVAYNTIFGIIDYKMYQEARVNVRRIVWHSLAVQGQAQGTFLSGDHAWRVLLGVANEFFSLNWSHQSGYSGVSDGVVGSVTKRLTRHWDCYVAADLSKYRIQPEEDTRMESYSGQGGIVWHSANGFEARVEGQLLRNALQNSDARIFLRISQSFSVSTESASRRTW